MGMLSEAFGVTSEEDSWGHFAAKVSGPKSGEEEVVFPEDDWAVNPPRSVSQKTLNGKFGLTGSELLVPAEVPATVYVCTYADTQGSLTWVVSTLEMEANCRLTLDVSERMSTVLVKKGKVPFEIEKSRVTAVKTAVMLPAEKWRAGKDGEVSPVIQGSRFYLALAILKTQKGEG